MKDAGRCVKANCGDVNLRDNYKIICTQFRAPCFFSATVLRRRLRYASSHADALLNLVAELLVEIDDGVVRGPDLQIDFCAAFCAKPCLSRPHQFCAYALTATGIKN